MNENPLANLLPDAGFCAIFCTFGCIGDSLSSGEFESLKDGVKGYHDLYEYSWGQFMARACGSKAYNFSKGGLTAKGFLENLHMERFDIFDPAKRCQAYIVALGANDISRILEGNLEMGTIADVHPDDPEQNPPTFAGHMGKILSYVKQVEEKARIFLVTIPQGHPDPARSALQDEHAQLIRQLAEVFPFTYVLDLRKYGPIYNDDFKRVYYLGGHLNPMGYLLTAKMFMTYIDHIIRERPQDFAQIGFLGMGGIHNEDAVW